MQALIASRLKAADNVTVDLKDLSSRAAEDLLASVAGDDARSRLAAAIDRARIGRPYGDETERDPSEAMGLIHYAAMEVARRLMASWSPILPVIGGLATEVGGPLSHPGTLAREFGLPAVLAVAGATALIEAGSRIHIDGARGTVHILD